MDGCAGGAFSYFAEIASLWQEAAETRKRSIVEEWEKSKDYPRKMKKRVRKELRLEWLISSYNPFD